MDGITLGEIATTIAFVAGIITGLTVIIKQIGKAINRWHLEAMTPVIEKLDEISARLRAVEIDNCKNYVVNFLSLVETGGKVTTDGLRRFWENYNLYQSLGGNSYVHEWVERLKRENKLSSPHTF